MDDMNLKKINNYLQPNPTILIVDVDFLWI